MEKLQIKISNHVKIVGALPSRAEGDLRDRLTFPNPKWIENDKYGYWQGETPETLSFFQCGGAGYLIPRGFTNQLFQILDYYRLPYQVIDRTRILPEVEFNFKGTIRPYQDEAIEAIVGRRFGVLEAPPGAGKTIIGLATIARRKQPVLILTHTKELLYQWQARAVQFLGMDKEEIGLIGDGKKNIGQKLTVGIVNSVLKLTDELRARISYLIIDECHRTPSRTFTEAVTGFDCRYMLGLSATPYRRDGLTKLIFLHIGDRVHKIETRDLQKEKAIMTARLVTRETGFKYDYRGPEDYQPMITTLAEDESRNRLISRDVLNASKNGNGVSLVISDRKEHCRTLAKMVSPYRLTRELYGDMNSKERKRIVGELNQGKVKILVATSQLIGEGFDLPSLSSLFLGTPIKFEGRVKQYVGRILRTDKGKEAPVIYDYLDRPGVLQAAYKARLRAYKDVGIRNQGLEWLWN
ncbi:MAG: DEAD/DEAH box helicase [Deltaproteobacteria bacterium]|nr:DEAD/DEAH box helicase [Deltaproteobacteria bacterium]